MTQNYTAVVARVPDSMAQRLDAFVEAGRGDALHPLSRSSVVRDALAAYLQAHAPASAPVRSRGGRHG